MGDENGGNRPAAEVAPGGAKNDLVRVRITNPAPGQAPFVGLKRAAKWVKTRKAVWVGDRLKLDASFRDVIRRQLAHGPQVPGCGYDEVRRPLTEQEKRHLPMIPPRGR